MQSAKQGTNHWQIDFDTLQGAGRWENELMGWGSTADYMQGTSMKFRSREDAVHFVSFACVGEGGGRARESIIRGPWLERERGYLIQRRCGVGLMADNAPSSRPNARSD